MRKTTVESMEKHISRLLFQYRNTPHTTTGTSPAELLLGRQPRSLLDLLQPDITTHAQHKQKDQKFSHDKRAKQREFQLGDLVYARKFPSGKDWIPGVIVKV